MKRINIQRVRIRIYKFIRSHRGVVREIIFGFIRPLKRRQLDNV